MKRYVHPPKSWLPNYFSLLLLLCLLPAFSCKKEDDSGPATDAALAGKYPFPIVLDATCKLAKSESSNGIILTFNYDASNRMAAYNSHVPARDFMQELNSSYAIMRDSDGSINKILEQGDNGTDLEMTIDYNESRNWIKTKIINKASSAYVIITPEYNRDGFLVKITRDNVDVNNSYKTIVEYTYENGNINAITNFINGKPVRSSLEYDLTKEGKWSEFDLLSVYMGAQSHCTRKY